MCGFAGIINFKSNLSKDHDVIEKMTSTLALRGPDQYGYAYYNNVLLGHRRLIVVDPSGGIQPMTKTRDGFKYTLIYNGELYNTEDIRQELISEGYKFDSYSDTEVLLTSYMCWGVNLVDKLNGIFAFAIYDEKLEQVLLVRDQLGVKPFFYSQKGSNIIFGSEIKTVLAHPLVSSTVDKEGLTEIFALGPAVKPGSAVFKDIKELPPAHLAIITKKDMVIKEYWTLEAKENNESLEECIDHLQFLLKDAIERQLVGDVPLCTFLSGGLDSSAISAVAAKALKEKGKTLTTYSLDYEDNDKFFKASLYQPTSDQYWALEMAKFLGSDHRTFTIKQTDLADALKSAVIARDLPGMADIDSSLFLFCKDIRKDFVVGLSGECADEIFGGYPWYTRPELRTLTTFPWSNFVSSRRQLLSPSLSNLSLEETVSQNYLTSIQSVPKIDGESPERSRTREIFYLNIKWFMVNLLNRKDRMSMANSLEVRVPFADKRLVEYAFNIPDEYLFYKGREKGLLRKALVGILPEEIIYRKKSPYPKTHNPAYTNLVCNMLEDIMANNNAPLFSLINKEFARTLIDTKGQAYTNPWFGQLMTGPQLIAYLVQLNIWLETYSVNLIF